MKTIKLFVAGALSAGFLLSACNQPAAVDCSKCVNQPSQPIQVDDKVRGEASKQLKAELALSLKEEFGNLKTVSILSKANMPKDLKTVETLLDKSPNPNATTAKEDAMLVNAIFNSLIAAENKASALDLELSMSEEPVQEGYFLFAISSQKSYTLNLQMFDERDLSLVANNSISILQGNNYKALNLKGFQAGDYILKLKDLSSDAEMVRKISILPEHL